MMLFLVVDTKCIDSKYLKMLLIQFSFCLLFLIYNSASFGLLLVNEDEHQQALVGQDTNTALQMELLGSSWPSADRRAEGNYCASLVKTWHRLTADQTSVWEYSVICICTNVEAIWESNASARCTALWSPLTRIDHKSVGPFIKTELH